MLAWHRGAWGADRGHCPLRWDPSTTAPGQHVAQLAEQPTRPCLHPLLKHTQFDGTSNTNAGFEKKGGHLVLVAVKAPGCGDRGRRGCLLSLACSPLQRSCLCAVLPRLLLVPEEDSQHVTQAAMLLQVSLIEGAAGQTKRLRLIGRSGARLTPWCYRAYRQLRCNEPLDDSPLHALKGSSSCSLLLVGATSTLTRALSASEGRPW